MAMTDDEIARLKFGDTITRDGGSANLGIYLGTWAEEEDHTPVAWALLIWKQEGPVVIGEVWHPPLHIYKVWNRPGLPDANWD